MAAKKKPGAQSSVTLKRLAAHLSESHELSKKQTEAVLGDLVGLLTKHLKKGDRVRIGGLDILTAHKRAARKGRNPRTDKLVQIKAKKVAARPEVVGTTPDGIRILRPKVNPDQFTSKEIRKAVTQAKKAAG